MIECTNISVGYGKVNILKDASFKAESGRITVLLGKNGCGKTTLFGAICGYNKYSGNILIDGKESLSLKPKERSKQISVMPQIMRCPDITVRELISYGRQPYTGFGGVLSQNDWDKVEMVIKKAELSTLADKKLNCISGGERQKAYFAMILAQETPNLLLDEPGAHLDAAYTTELCQLLASEKANGKTILAVFHDVNRVIEIADKIILINDETTAFYGNPFDFCQSGLVEKIFGLKKYIATPSQDDKTEKCFFI